MLFFLKTGSNEWNPLGFGATTEKLYLCVWVWGERAACGCWPSRWTLESHRNGDGRAEAKWAGLGPAGYGLQG